MNYKKVFNDLGKILLIEAVLLVIPMVLSLIFHDGAFKSFAFTIGIVFLAGILLSSLKPKKNNIYAKEGYMIVALSWLLMSAFGALPFYIGKYIPKYIDAFFETVSGFTTTGSTILQEIECLPKSILFWRSFTHFIGGMGILVFVIAILPKAEGSDMHIMRAEVPGPTVGKLVSKIKASARILYTIYFGLTVIMAGLLLAGGMPLFDSVANAFATAGTGGFSVLNEGIAGYNSPYAEVVISVFMMLFGVNFNLYYMLLIRQGRRAIKDEEIRWYLGIITAATFLITLTLTVTKHPFKEALRHAFFQVTSIISTTGFTSTDFEYWPIITKAILILLMFVGGCVGSTGGGLKVSRIAILFKSSIRSIRKAINPKRIEVIKMDGRTVGDDVVNGINGYFAAFMLTLAISFFIVAIDGHDLISSATGVITCITNVGPGFSEVGPTGNFSQFSFLSKLILSLDMLAGRLELVPILMLFSKNTYTK